MKNQHQHFNNNVRTLIPVFVCLALILGIGAFTYTCTQKHSEVYTNQPQIETVYDEEAVSAGGNAVSMIDILKDTKKETKNSYIYPLPVLNNLQYTKTLQCVQLALSQYNIDFDIEEFYQDYLDTDINYIGDENVETQGMFGPESTAKLVNRYLIDGGYAQVKVIATKDIKVHELGTIVDNNWPTIIYYTKDFDDFDGELQYWPFANPYIVSDVTDNSFELFDPNEGSEHIKAGIFSKTWDQCGHHAIIFYS